MANTGSREARDSCLVQAAAQTGSGSRKARLRQAGDIAKGQSSRHSGRQRQASPAFRPVFKP
ncbi:hypothetical protein BJF92_13840 [Rhizobium rhizosphaerae]|uniref:Uncharacterized protein n=1 Tax=Xaviernesmea rhizosphaerae TaxID=1672749 RepID=A0A1Q9AI03_9HYPH|nr:hypothetical protein BJF92_13840 [Xaviernesmea rhizosphaerae]